MSHNDFDKRMKEYEQVFTQQKIVPHMPIIMRIDGKCFHNFTKGCDRPFDKRLQSAFQCASTSFYQVFHYALAYGQSDEVSFLIYHPDTHSQEDFEGKIFKLCSVGASAFTSLFNVMYLYHYMDMPRAMFDCRVFQLPEKEIINYFIWRQKDAVRNSIQMVGQSFFSHKELHGKSCNDIQDMLYLQKGINWDNYKTACKRGWCIYENGKKLDTDIPIFTQERDFIESKIPKGE